jgi:hypothetical protein
VERESSKLFEEVIIRPLFDLPVARWTPMTLIFGEGMFLQNFAFKRRVRRIGRHRAIPGGPRCARIKDAAQAPGMAKDVPGQWFMEKRRVWHLGHDIPA